MKGSTSGAGKFVRKSLDCLTCSIRLLQADKMSEDRLQDKRGSSHATKKTNEVIICIIMYI